MIMITAYYPVIDLASRLSTDTSFLLNLLNITMHYQIGKSWLVTALLVIFMMIFTKVKKDSKRSSIIKIIALIAVLISIGAASHSSTITKWSGMFGHSVHLISVTIWAGTLIIVSWFSVNKHNWILFLTWYTPLARTCFFIVMAAGLYLMSLTVSYQDYPDSWILPYGQSLLIKHVMLVPLLYFIFINSRWVKKRLIYNPTFDPRRLARVETIFILFIFIVTGTLGQNSPPHNIKETWNGEGYSVLFQLFFQVEEFYSIGLTFTTQGILFLLLTGCFTTLIFAELKREGRAGIALVCGIFTFICLYLGIMESVTLH